MRLHDRDGAILETIDSSERFNLVLSPDSYLVSVEATAGTGRFTFEFDEGLPNIPDTPSPAVLLTLGTTTIASVNAPVDRGAFTVDLEANETYRIAFGTAALSDPAKRAVFSMLTSLSGDRLGPRWSSSRRRRGAIR
jgi:hypothetical protein